MKALVGIVMITLLAFVLYPLLQGDDGSNTEGTSSERGPKTFAAERQTKETPATSTAGDSATGAQAATSPSDNGSTVADGEVKPAAPKITIERPNMFPNEPLADIVFGVLRDVRLGKVGEKDREGLEQRLVTILTIENMGSDETRKQAAATSISTILRQAAKQTASGPMTSFQQESMKILASEFASDLYRRLPMGGGQGHEGTLRAAVEVKLPDGYEKAPWATIGGFDYEEGMTLPPSVTALNGKKVGVTGYMMTLEEVEDIHEFLLVESLWSCCFGTPPEVHQVLVISIEPGVEFTTAPVLLLGTIEVGEEEEDGFVTSLYRLKATSMKEIE